MSAELRPHVMRGEPGAPSPGPAGLRARVRSPDGFGVLRAQPVHGFLRTAGNLFDLYREPQPPVTEGEFFGDAWLVSGAALRDAAMHICPRGPSQVKLGPFEAKFRDALADVLTRTVILSVKTLIDDPEAGELRDVLRGYIEGTHAGQRTAERSAEPARSGGPRFLFGDRELGA